MTSVSVVGAGNGGLTTAAILAKAGLNVTVLESHTYPGGCAGTFRRKQYRFDAGATLAGGFNPGEVMDLIRKEVNISDWHARIDTATMTVHLPNDISIPRFGDLRRWEVRKAYFGDSTLAFWKWQERTADILWDFARRAPPFPPQGHSEQIQLVKMVVNWIGEHWASLRLELLRDAFTPIGYRLRSHPEILRQFVDGQLLISAQTIGRYANALFSASALDLPRRGVVHLSGGIGTIAHKLQQAVIQNGGDVKFRQRVTSIRRIGRKWEVTTAKERFISDVVVANLTPWNLKNVLRHVPRSLSKLPPSPDDGWGAFMIYLGIDSKYVPDGISLHHQIIGEGKLTEGNSIFISLSPTWDPSRAPPGKRAVTISTHTHLGRWWALLKDDMEKYSSAKRTLTQRMLGLARTVIPAIGNADLVESATPVTFQHFTQRTRGWVGGFKQTSLFRTFAPRIDDGLWLVGDSIFPGQSTAAVSLGGLRVARSIINSI